jgi:Fe-S-cluster-containing hydrogenase component 2
MKLSEIIEVDKEKCVNCHRCISACPVKFCNDEAGNT